MCSSFIALQMCNMLRNAVQFPKQFAPQHFAEVSGWIRFSFGYSQQVRDDLTSFARLSLTLHPKRSTSPHSHSS